MATSNFKNMDKFDLFVLLDLDDEDLDQFVLDYICTNIESEIEDFNSCLKFHQLTLVNGYYNGLQLYVETVHDVETMDNDNCKLWFDECRSTSIKQYHAEENKIRRFMEKISKEYGFIHLYELGILSSGETVYGIAAEEQKTKKKGGAAL